MLVRFGDHTKQRMRERQIDPADVFETLKNPVRGVYRPPNGKVEYFGWCADGRPLLVVTNAVGDFVITVVIQ